LSDQPVRRRPTDWHGGQIKVTLGKHVNPTGNAMIELAGKTAFVTGGASGIGLALGEVLAQAGMNVMLADIEGDALGAAVKRLSDLGLKNVTSVVCDVADLSSMEEAAEAAYRVFGAVHVVCNNAGVAAGSGIDDISVETWRWVLDVNLMGVLHGISTFLPHIRAHGEGGHIVNTASMAGLNSGLGFSPYSAAKFAVVNMSEGLAMQLKPFGIGVTVLCPGFVQTRIWDARRNRQERYGAAPALSPGGPAARLADILFDLNKAGIDPLDVAKQTVAAIRQNELYVFTHAGPQWRAELEQRFNAILLAMDKTAAALA
jgi:NAD(P)-dependent dehydrogenase (short-subunit alcohol dehydrogenase family)